MHLLNNYPLTIKTLIAGLTMSFSLMANAYETQSFCFGENDTVCVNEHHDMRLSEAQGTDLSYYTVSNNGTEQIYGFGVTNSTRGDGAFRTYDLTGWDAATFSAAEWDSGENVFNFHNSASELITSWTAGAKTVEQPDMLGSFADLFGGTTNDNGDPLFVNFYWNARPSHFLEPNTTAGIPRRTTAYNGQFYYYGTPESEATTFNLQGDIVGGTHTNALITPTRDMLVITDTAGEGGITDNLLGGNALSNVSAVPEPETYMLFLAGLGLLSIANRRKNANVAV